MSQEQLVIAGVVALNLVLLILLTTAYRLITARAQPKRAQSLHEQPQYAQPLHAQRVQQPPHTQLTRTALSTEAEEIRHLEALFAHDSWSAPGVDGAKE